MGLYSVGIIVLGSYVNPSRYLEDVKFLIDEYTEDGKGGDYPTLYLMGSSNYSMQFNGELGIVHGSDSKGRTLLTTADVDNITEDEFKSYVDKILSTGLLRHKSKGDFLGLWHPLTSMKFTSPEWEGLDITVIYNYMFKRTKIKDTYDLLIVIDNPPNNMTNTDSLIKSLLDKGTEDVYLYTDRPKEDLTFLKEFGEVNVDRLQS